MPEPAPESLLDRLRRLDAEATPEPWFANVNDLIGGMSVGTKETTASRDPAAESVADMLSKPNADFIALTAIRSHCSCGSSILLRRWQLRMRYRRARAVRHAMTIGP